jgi:hypothetical protein
MQALEALALYFLINLQCVDIVAPAIENKSRQDMVPHPMITSKQTSKLQNQKNITKPKYGKLMYSKNPQTIFM